VEDQPEVRAFALVALQRYGYTVYSAGSGDEAIAFCRQFTEPLHLILTDVVMAGMNGPELAKEMATLRPGLRVLFMSGYTDNVISHQGVLPADVAYVQKPFTAESLAEKIRAALDA
jgi:CheY-like chemotaxis protein